METHASNGFGKQSEFARLDATQISAELGIIRSQLTELVARSAALPPSGTVRRR